MDLSALRKLVDELQIDSLDMDELVIDVHMANASNINNGGVDEQLKYLMEQYQGNPEELKMLIEALAEGP